MNRRALNGLIVVLVIVAIVVITRNTDSISRQFDVPLVEAYALVADSISTDAPIFVSLPDGVKKDGIEKQIVIEPEVRGAWIEVNSDKHVAFKPSKPLEVGRYYSVSLTTPEGVIKKEFRVDVNPEIDAVFPHAGSETHEANSITILFNRPMVPLTTLNELDKIDVPVTITPETPGKWKWISTRNLQFIPEEDLVRSSNYKVTVEDNLTSVDGLPVEGTVHSFITRPLRYVDSRSVRHGGELNFNEPLRIAFNQPVDLKASIDRIKLFDQNSKQKAFDASYATRTYTKKGKEVEEVDQTVIEILPRQDRHGRKNLWDFDERYRVSMRGAIPTEGDIESKDVVNISLSVAEIITGITATSERSDFVTPNLFDPEGTLEVAFAEDIDLKKSKLEALGLVKVEYKQKCQVAPDGEFQSSRSMSLETCEKEDDLRRFVLHFNANKLSLGQQFPIRFEKLVNTDGLTINVGTIIKNITVYPKLQILKTSPDNGDNSAHLRTLIVCTNSPLLRPEMEDFKKHIVTTKHLVPSRWNRPYLVTSVYGGSRFSCDVGQYSNSMTYGLLPENSYDLTLKLEDDFGQKAEKKMSFVTTSPSGFYQSISGLQKEYNVTNSERTKLTYMTENMTYAEVHLCEVSPENFLHYRHNRIDRTTPGTSLSCIGQVSDVIDLPDTFWVNHYFQLDIANYFPELLGHYIVSIGHPDYTDYQGKNRIYNRSFLSVTDISLVEKDLHWTDFDSNIENTKRLAALGGVNGNLYWAAFAKSLVPLTGATIEVYTQEERAGASGARPTLAKRTVAGATGVAETPLVADVVGAVARFGADSAVTAATSDKFYYGRHLSSDERIYVYTDRPMYRPGDTVNIKGIYRYGLDGTYDTLDKREIDLKIVDSRGEVLAEEIASLSAFGTFSTEIKLASGASLGSYRIDVSDQYSSGRFDVEEYVPAAFEATVTADKDEYMAGETTDIEIEGRYYFGVPLDGGTVNYSLTAQDYHFDRYTDEYFNFGGGWYYCYRCSYGDSYIGRGELTLDADGKARLETKLDFEELFGEDKRDKSKIMVLHATIQDSEGKSVSASHSFIVHRGQYYIGAKLEPSYAAENQTVTLRTKTVDTEGTPVGKSGLLAKIEKVEWKSYKRKEVDGGYYYNWEEERTLVKEEKIKTDGKGDHRFSFSLAEAGSYEVTVSGSDSLGNKISTETNLYIHGRSAVSVRPTNNTTLNLSAERTDLATGDTAKLIIESPTTPAKALVSLDRGKVFAYEIIDIDQNITEYSFLVEERFAPNIFASVTLLTGEPGVKYGNVELSVDREVHEIDVEVNSNKEFYLPGEEVTLDITTKDYKGRPVSADVSIAAVDLSVLALSGNQKKDPLVFFYGGFPLSVQTSSNLKNFLPEIEIPTGTKGGGGAKEALDLATRARGEFRDTAFWKASVVTAANGVGRITFTLPDNLTRWQVESLGVTGDTKLGVGYKEFTARKELMTIPLAPRFIVPGDEFKLGAKVFNQTTSSQRLEVSLSDTTLSLAGNASRTVNIKPGETETIYFDVVAPKAQDTGWHKFTLSAKNDRYNDTVLRSLPITKNQTYEYTSTASFTKEDLAREYIYIPDNIITDQGGVTLKANATMAVYLSDSLNYMVSYPYGCSEQMVSKLGAIAVVKKGLDIKNVGDKFDLDEIEFNGATYSMEEVMKIGLDRIYQNQTPGGGFSYYSSFEPNFHLTLHVLSTMQDIKEAGFAVNESVMARAAKYLMDVMNGKVRDVRGNPYLIGTDDRIFAAYALSHSGLLSGSVEDLINKKLDRRYLGEEASTSALVYLALLTTEGHLRWDKREIWDHLENRVDIDSRGAYLRSASNVSWGYYETPIKNTALFLKALAADENEHKLLDKINRWLLASRDKEGAWGSTNNTLIAIDAMTDFLAWSRETEAEFDLDIVLNGEVRDTFEIRPATVLDTFSHFIPVSELPINSNNKLELQRTRHNDLTTNFYYDALFKYFLPIEAIAPRDEGFTVERTFYHLIEEEDAEPEVAREAEVGEVLRGELVVTTAKNRRTVAIEDFIPAGFELVNFDLATEDRSLLGLEAEEEVSPYDYRGGYYDDYGYSPYGPVYRSTFEEMRDDRLFVFMENVSPGKLKYEYYIRATTPGTFHHLPAVVSEMYFPENFGRSRGDLFTITE